MIPLSLGQMSRLMLFHKGKSYSFVAMILYNVTMNVDLSIEEEWLNWMKNVHVKDVLATGFFINHKIFRLISQEQQGVTYAFQYFANSIEDIEKYQESFGPKLQMDVVNRYGEGVMTFRTLLESMD